MSVRMFFIVLMTNFGTKEKFFTESLTKEITVNLSFQLFPLTIIRMSVPAYSKVMMKNSKFCHSSCSCGTLCPTAVRPYVTYILSH